MSYVASRCDMPLLNTANGKVTYNNLAVGVTKTSEYEGSGWYSVFTPADIDEGVWLALTGNQDVETILANGKGLKFEARGSGQWHWYEKRDPEGSFVYRGSFGNGLESNSDKQIVSIINFTNTSTSVTDKRLLVSLYNGTSSIRANFILQVPTLFDDMPPDHVWKSWNQLNGNNGQYRCNLTKINDEDIHSSIDGYHGYDLEDFSIVSNESSIWNSFLNAQLGVEYDVAWSGRCKATLTVTDFVSDATLKVFTFKFYFPDQTTPFFTFTQNIPISSVTPSNNIRNYYLTFLYDSENECGAFYPIAYLPQSVAKYQTLGTGTLSDDDMTYMWMWLQASSAGDPEYPYDTGTTDNGGQPTTDLLPNDLMPTVTTPTLAGTASGLFTIYCPDDTDLANIAAFLWSDNVIDNFKKYFNNFSDNIIALYVLPYKPSNLPTKAFKVGRVVSDTITSVEYVTTRFVTIDMGEVTIGGCWDSYLDFSPYTKFNVYLPGIGVEALDADDILAPLDKNKNFGEELGSTISLQYNLDLMTGIVVAYVKINGQIRYQFSGKIGYSIPLTGETHRTLLQGFAMATAGAIGTIASGGTAAPFAAAAASAAIINAMKPDVYRGSNLSGDAASLCYETPYLIRRVPNKPQLVNQDRFTGFQSYKTGLLSEFSGYTEVEEVHAEGFVCTEEEREEIIELLKKGVIL